MRPLCLAAALAGCDTPPPTGWSGYAEGDYVRIAAPVAGTLATLAVQAGQPVDAGAALFTLDATPEAAARAEAAARLLASQAQALNIASGRRDDELAVARAQLGQAQAAAALAGAEQARLQTLLQQGFVAQAAVDDAGSALQQRRARVAELEAALRVAELPARPAEREAARATAAAAGQALQQADWRLAQTAQRAPVAGRVSETYFRVGEWVAAGAPVLALLPVGAVKLRFFVAQAELPGLSAGQTVLVRCDGCGEAIPAQIRRIASQAEYTPPVIYSNSQRARLVFMVEAWPAPADAARLRPGQPVEVRRAVP